MPLQPGQEAGRLAPHQLRRVGVALLRHDAGAGGPRLGQRRQPELLGAPEHQLLRQPGERQRAVRRDGEIREGGVTSGDRVHGVGRGRREAELGGDHVAVEVVVGPGERARRQAASTSCRRQPANRSQSRCRAKKYASRWCASTTGWARCRWVYPGKIRSLWRLGQSREARP